MKKVLLVAVTIVAVIALGNVVLASAQGNPPFGQNGTCPVTGYTCPYSGTMPYGGMMGGRGVMGMHGYMLSANGMHEQVWTAVAEKLGMTYAELNTVVQGGQTVVQLAQAKGVSLDDLQTAARDAVKTSFAELVKQGVIAQQQADWMLDRMDDTPMFNFDQGFGPGTMNGWNNGVTPNRYGPSMMGRGPGGMMRGWQQPTLPQS